MFRFPQIVSIALFCLIFFKSLGQSPAHFVIGENELVNIHVYSLKERSDGLLFAATNNGLYKYQNGKFKSIPFKGEHRGDAVFSIVLNSKEELFCCNLSGEIFQLIDGGLTRILQTPKEFCSSHFDFAFDHHDRVIIQSEVTAIYDGKWELVAPNEGSTRIMNAFNPAHLLFCNIESNKIYQLRGKSLSLVDSINDPTQLGWLLPSFVNEKMVTLSNKGCIGLIQENKYLNCAPGSWNLQQIDQNEFWMRSVSSGVKTIAVNNDKINVSDYYFKNQFISAVTKSSNGVYFLGTFGKGVIVIPHISTKVYQTGKGELDGICTIPNNFTFDLMDSSRIFSIRKSDSNSLLVSYDRVFYEENVPFSINNKIPYLLYQNNHSNSFVGALGTLKDAVRVNDSCALVASSNGVYWVGRKRNKLFSIRSGNGNIWWRLNQSGFRVHAVGYGADANEIYFATKEGLFFLTDDGVTKEVLFEGKTITCFGLESQGDRVYCATKNQGILQIVSGNTTKVYPELKDVAVYKTLHYKQKLYVAHSKGFEVFDLKTKQRRFIGSAYGVYPGSVKNFTVHQSHIWMVSNGRLLSIPDDGFNSKLPFHLMINGFKVGDSLVYGNNISSNYDNNSLKILLDFRGVLYEKEAKIEYQLNTNPWESVAATSPSIDFNALAPGEYVVNLRVNFHGNYSEQQTLFIEIRPPFWQTIWFYLFSIVFVGLLLFLYFRRTLKKAKQKQELQLSEQRLRTEVLESELKGLRSQMNPHFIFNSLNSIQDLILREETEHSYDYIVLFAKLVRNTLNYSNQGAISMEKELDFLQVYLSLEKLRFQKDFEFEITYEGDLDVEIPSLLIQPFVENAIVHGLMHKKGLKRLHVHFEKKDQMLCTIEDNGIGREKSKEINQRQRGEHQSFAMDAIKQRMTILNKQLGQELGKYEIIDLVTNGTAEGTKVIVTIPFTEPY